MYQEKCKLLLINCGAVIGYEQVAKRIANIRLITERKGWKKDEENKNVYGSRSVYESFDIIRM